MAAVWNTNPKLMPFNTVLVCQVQELPAVHVYMRRDEHFVQAVQKNTPTETIVAHEVIPLERVTRWIDPSTIPDAS